MVALSAFKTGAFGEFGLLERHIGRFWTHTKKIGERNAAIVGLFRQKQTQKWLEWRLGTFK